MRRVKFYSTYLPFCLSFVLLVIAGSRYKYDTNYSPPFKSQRETKDVHESMQTLSNIGSTDAIDNILEKQRVKIEFEVRRYNFTYSGVQQMNDLVMEMGGQPLRSIIFSTWRSGSTFLGQIVNSMPGNFYHYEPLIKYGVAQIRDLTQANKALKTIKNLFKCDFRNVEGYSNTVKTNISQFLPNTRLWNHCKNNKEFCSDVHLLGRFCKLFPFQSMKILRMRLQFVLELLKDKELNVRAVLLVRDPRGVMWSRRQAGGCAAPDCGRPARLCADLASDHAAAARLLRTHPTTLLVLRYEELALNPNKITNSLLKFLRLSKMPAIDKFLKIHTNVNSDVKFSTFRLSRERPFRWKHNLEYNYVKTIQLVCKEAMHLWGYRIVDNATQMISREFNPLKIYPIEL